MTMIWANILEKIEKHKIILKHFPVGRIYDRMEPPNAKVLETSIL